MKRISLPVLVLAIFSTLTFLSPVNAQMMDKTLSGTVKSVSLTDLTKGTKSEIIVTDASGKDLNVLVKANTTLYGVDAKALSLDKIIAGSKVNVVYVITPEGVFEAKSIVETK